MDLTLTQLFCFFDAGCSCYPKAFSHSRFGFTPSEFHLPWSMRGTMRCSSERSLGFNGDESSAQIRRYQELQSPVNAD
jgi:hypothetical protein